MSNPTNHQKCRLVETPIYLSHIISAIIATGRQKVGNKRALDQRRARGENNCAAPCFFVVVVVYM